MVTLVRSFVREFASFGALVSFMAMIAMWGDFFGRAGRF
jgi:hypothetical protein